MKEKDDNYLPLFTEMTEQEYNGLPFEDKIKLTNIVIGVVRKSGHLCIGLPLRYPRWNTPEADLFRKPLK